MHAFIASMTCRAQLDMAGDCTKRAGIVYHCMKAGTLLRKVKNSWCCTKRLLKWRYRSCNISMWSLIKRIVGASSTIFEEEGERRRRKGTQPKNSLYLLSRL